MICRYPTLLPKTLPDGRKYSIWVPCGRCAWCSRQKRNEWFVRFLEESKTSIYTRFVTLDYRDEDLPIDMNVDTGEIMSVVSLRDVQLYHKKLRKKYGNHSFRFFLASEYGKEENTARPHYHAIYWSNMKIPFYDEWPHGDHGADLPASVGSFKYVTKYILKGQYCPDGASPNFHVMSRRPGIGASFNSQVNDNTHFYRYYNKIMRLPTYYSRKFNESMPEELRQIQSEMKLDYLSTQSKYETMLNTFVKNAPDGQLIDDWINDLYLKDLRKQYQINKK